ncbi:MAG: hypothetical protein CME67_06780 [Halobacteriovoraceae bacterium]|nr:hypothetical protein [Halobacteriovoraceae bacterium]|tara:strand:- start:2802 stop:3074 length:273 start_codon:yes stop_codon:yes gene_type:complete
MRILMTTLLCTFGVFASIDYSRFDQEMEFLRNNAFKGKQELAKEEFGQEGPDLKSSLEEDVVDLDQLYFSDSISTKSASPEKKPKQKRSF